MSKESYRVLLVGDGGVGKTTYLEKVRTDFYTKQYIPTMGAEIKIVLAGDTILKVWDIAGQEKLSEDRLVYYADADAVVFMYDCTSRITKKT